MNQDSLNDQDLDLHISINHHDHTADDLYNSLQPHCNEHSPNNDKVTYIINIKF